MLAPLRMIDFEPALFLEAAVFVAARVLAAGFACLVDFADLAGLAVLVDFPVARPREAVVVLTLGCGMQLPSG